MHICTGWFFVRGFLILFHIEVKGSSDDLLRKLLDLQDNGCKDILRSVLGL